jgi:hypothetical protein
MKPFALTFATICGVAVAGLSASAQQALMRGPTVPKGILNPVVGSSSVYDMKTPKGDETIEFAIVGKDSVNGKDAFWFEFNMTGGQMPMVSKMLMTFDGTHTAYSRIIFQMGNIPPMEMPAQMIQAGAQPPSDVRSVGDVVGTEPVTTPAGTFVCEHYHMKDGSGDTWVSDKVLPIAVVKHVDKDSTMILVKTSSDAKDKITGTPQPFSPAAFMQLRQNQQNQ